MAYYRVNIDYPNNRKSQFVDKYSAEKGRWERSHELEKREPGVKCRMRTAVTSSKVNKKVLNSTTMYPDGTIVRAQLLTTSNRYPKKYDSRGNLIKKKKTSPRKNTFRK